MIQDIRFAIRMHARNPGVTGLATIALALGIGGSTLIFSIVNAVLLRPLPVSDPGRLVWIWADSPSRNLAYAFTAYSTFAAWREGSASFESMSAYAPASAALISSNDAERVDLLQVNAGFFPCWAYIRLPAAIFGWKRTSRARRRWPSFRSTCGSAVSEATPMS
jgi:hypothetical protein